MDRHVIQEEVKDIHIYGFYIMESNGCITATVEPLDRYAIN